MTKLMKKTMKLTAISMILVIALSSCAFAAPRRIGSDHGRRIETRTVTRTTVSHGGGHHVQERVVYTAPRVTRVVRHEPVRHHYTSHSSSNAGTAIAAGILGIVIGAAISNNG